MILFIILINFSRIARLLFEALVLQQPPRMTGRYLHVGGADAHMTRRYLHDGVLLA